MNIHFNHILDTAFQPLTGMICHSAETSEVTFFLPRRRDEGGTVPTAAAGFSLGGNMLSFLLGEQGGNRLLNRFRQNAERKLIAWPGALPVNLAQLKGLKKLPGVHKPLPIIHAKDDPVMTDEVIPDPGLLPSSVEYQLPRYSEHMGLVGGTLFSAANVAGTADPAMAFNLAGQPT